MHGGVGADTLRPEMLRQLGLGEELAHGFVRDCLALAGEPVEICLPSHVNQTNLAGNLPGDPMDYRPFVDSTVWPALMEERARAVQALYPAVYGQATR